MPDLLRERHRWYVHDASFHQHSYPYSLPDFCFWAPQALDNIADTEGEEVAWCTKKGHGTRIVPQGTILGAQVLKNNDYWMITGLVDQTRLNIQAGDYGGELDSGGQDGVGVLDFLTTTRDLTVFG